jgi:hypothetical protein
MSENEDLENIVRLDEIDETTPLIDQVNYKYLTFSLSYFMNIFKQLGLSVNSIQTSVIQNGILQLRDNDNSSNQKSTASRIFNERIKRHFPTKFIVFNMSFSILLNVFMIIGERTQPNSFEANDLEIISYHTLNGFILYASIFNIAFAILGLITSELNLIRLVI